MVFWEELVLLTIFCLLSCPLLPVLFVFGSVLSFQTSRCRLIFTLVFLCSPSVFLSSDLLFPFTSYLS